MMRLSDHETAIRSQLANNRPLGLSHAWELLCEHALKCELAACVQLLALIRREASPLSAGEDNALIRWESQLLGYIGLACHDAGEFTLAEEAYRRCMVARQRLVDQRGLCQLEASRALLATGPHRGRSSRLLRQMLGKAKASLLSISPTAVLGEFAQDQRWLVRRQALGALASLGEFQPIVAALKHDDVQIRRDAITHLSDDGARFPPSEAIAILANDDEDWYVRCQAARLLGDVQGYVRAREALREALWAFHPLLRMAAVQALARPANDQAVQDILPSLDDPSVEVQLAVIAALVVIGTEAVVPALERVPEHHDLLGRNTQSLSREAIRRIRER